MALDWRPKFDERSRNYPVRELLADYPSTPRSYTWSCNTWLDQKSEGACVGFSIAHEIAAKPQAHAVTNDTALDIYREAQKIDEWPGEAYSGTSVLAGMKTASAMGWYAGYRWAFSLQDVLIAVSYYGPAVIGVWWRQGMWNTDQRGYIHAAGEKIGGHAILLNGVDTYTRTVRLHNSWGRGWGTGGDARLTWNDLSLLLADSGEACIPTQRL